MRVRLPCLKNINLGQFQGIQVKSTLSKALNPLKVRGDIQQMTRISTKKISYWCLYICCSSKSD